jgi:hypothetical protein
MLTFVLGVLVRDVKPNQLYLPFAIAAHRIAGIAHTLCEALIQGLIFILFLRKRPTEKYNILLL